MVFLVSSRNAHAKLLPTSGEERCVTTLKTALYHTTEDVALRKLRPFVAHSKVERKTVVFYSLLIFFS